VKQALKGMLERLAPLDVWQQLRWGATLRLKVRAARFARRQRRVLARVSQAGAPPWRVNLGCGPLPIDGWLNVDGAAPLADLLAVLGEPLPLPTACAELVFSEHVLEHLEYPTQAGTFLAEACRILRPAGIFRVIVPDAEKAMRLYTSGDADGLRAMAGAAGSPIELVNKLFREGGFHRWAWDYSLLERELRRAGFSRVRRASFRDSATAELNVDHDQAERIGQSLYAEAVR
jgi:predicted SAM-dependent methyltransferase